MVCFTSAPADSTRRETGVSDIEVCNTFITKVGVRLSITCQMNDGECFEAFQ